MGPTKQDIRVLQELADVSRETIERLTTLEERLRAWQLKINLVSSATLPEFWTRHIVDSAQLWPHIPPHSETVVDIGSGAGFPGLVLGALSAQYKGPVIHMVESDSRKAAFLKTSAHAIGARAEVHNCRVESLEAWKSAVVTARACAPLANLLDYAEPFLTEETRCLFPKGRNAETELTEAQEYWRFSWDSTPSRIPGDGQILVLTKIARTAS